MMRRTLKCDAAIVNLLCKALTWDEYVQKLLYPAARLHPGTIVIFAVAVHSDLQTRIVSEAQHRPPSSQLLQSHSRILLDLHDPILLSSLFDLNCNDSRHVATVDGWVFAFPWPDDCRMTMTNAKLPGRTLQISADQATNRLLPTSLQTSHQLMKRQFLQYVCIFVASKGMNENMY
jgi:hypothetical protein